MDLLYYIWCLDQQIYAAGGRLYVVDCLISVVAYLALVALMWQKCLDP